MLTDVEIEIELEIEIEIENISILSILSILSTLSTLSTLSYLSYLPYLSTLSYLACLCLPRENRALSDGASDTGDELSSQVQDQVEEEEKMEKFWDEHDAEASEHVSPTQGSVIGKSMWYLIYLSYLSILPRLLHLLQIQNFLLLIQTQVLGTKIHIIQTTYHRRTATRKIACTIQMKIAVKHFRLGTKQVLLVKQK